MTRIQSPRNDLIFYSFFRNHLPHCTLSNKKQNRQKPVLFFHSTQGCL